VFFTFCELVIITEDAVSTPLSTNSLSTNNSCSGNNPQRKNYLSTFTSMSCVCSSFLSIETTIVFFDLKCVVEQPKSDRPIKFIINFPTALPKKDSI
jgi:hypothetical protein